MGKSRRIHQPLKEEHGQLYFAYGSNLHQLQMHRRCETSIAITIAELPGYRMVFKGHICGWSGVATIEYTGCEKDKVFGAVYRIFKKDLVALDKYEGYPRMYTREDVLADTPLGQMDVMVYVMTEGYEPALPSTYYLATINQGYRDWGIHPRSIKKAMQDTKKDIDKFFNKITDKTLVRLYEDTFCSECVGKRHIEGEPGWEFSDNLGPFTRQGLINSLIRSSRY